MKKYLSVYFDGCNGVRRGQVFIGNIQDLPGFCEQTPGVFKNGDEMLIELHDEEAVPVSEYCETPGPRTCSSRCCPTH